MGEQGEGETVPSPLRFTREREGHLRLSTLDLLSRPPRSLPWTEASDSSPVLTSLPAQPLVCMAVFPCRQFVKQAFTKPSAAGPDPLSGAGEQACPASALPAVFLPAQRPLSLRAT